MPDSDSFLSRWSRRKDAVRRGEPAPDKLTQPTAPPAEPPVGIRPRPTTGSGPAPSAPTANLSRPAAEGPPPVATPNVPPPSAPTLDEARALTPQADFRRFVGRDVDPQVKHTALKTLFSDPHFNVMDGLDTYIEDYGRPDPIPASMLAQLVTPFLKPPVEDPSRDEAPAVRPADPASGEASPLEATAADAGVATAIREPDPSALGPDPLEASGPLLPTAVAEPAAAAATDAAGPAGTADDTLAGDLR